MTTEELQGWLREHICESVAFMDYEPTIDSDDKLAPRMGFWFGNVDWKESGHELAHLGIDEVTGR